MAEDRLPAAWIARTKLVAPRPGPATVVDPALLAALRRDIDACALTLVSAQAGAGKTTLAAALAAGIAPDGVAWISLDAGDDDLTVLLHLLAMALDPVLPRGGVPRCTTCCGRACRAPVTGAAARACSSTTCSSRIPDPSCSSSTTSTASPTPRRSSRSSPCLTTLHRRCGYSRRRAPTHRSASRRRVRGVLSEVRATELRWTPDRADVLLNGHLDLRLSPAQVEHAVTASGGWITGLRLRGESLARGGAEATTTPAALADYLAEEVLDTVAEDVRRFLLDTSVLDDLAPAPGRAVSGRDDAGAVLAALHRSHPFLVELTEPAHYRYQGTFRAFLQGRVEREMPSRLASPHRRAAAAVDEPAVRVEHLLAGGAHDEAAGDIERLARVALHRAAAARGLAGWIARLDPPHRHRPWLAVVAGQAAVTRGELHRAAALLEGALEWFTADGDVPGQWLAARHLHLATQDHARFGTLLARLEQRPCQCRERARCSPAGR